MITVSDDDIEALISRQLDYYKAMMTALYSIGVWVGSDTSADVRIENIKRIVQECADRTGHDFIITKKEVVTDGLKG